MTALFKLTQLSGRNLGANLLYWTPVAWYGDGTRRSRTKRVDAVQPALVTVQRRCVDEGLEDGQTLIV